MNRIYFKFFIAIVIIFGLDQAIKILFIEGLRYDGSYFSLILTYNKGVAFSMFAFLGSYLKYIQVALLLTMIIYLFYEKKLLNSYPICFGMLLGAGASNIFDRFIHGGVVDYVFWHKWFEFAVFNFADVIIDISIGLIFISMFFKKNKNLNENP